MLKNIYKDYLLQNEIKEELYLFIDEIRMSDEILNLCNNNGKKVEHQDMLQQAFGISCTPIGYRSGAFAEGADRTG